MKKYLLLIAFLISIHCLLAQKMNKHVFINEFNSEIPIYSDSIGNLKVHSIFQDSIFEHFYEVDIRKESALRYEVHLFCVSQDNSPQVEGWVDKKFCSVYLSPTRYGIIKLYDLPNITSSYIELDNIYITISATVISTSKQKDKFIKVAFIYAGKCYEGWVDKYCPTIYNSCS